MDRKLKIYIAILIGILLLIVFVDSMKKKPINWQPTYTLDNKNPYDLYVFNKELSQIIPESRVKRVTKTAYEYVQENSERAIYLYIKKDIYSMSDTVLLDYVAMNGSVLVMSGENFFRRLTDKLDLRYTDIDSKASLLKKNELKLTYTAAGMNANSYVMDKVNNSFSFVDMDSTVTTVLGRSVLPNGAVNPNFIRIRYGKGFIFLHNQPQVFTNYALLSSKGSMQYVAGFLSYLPSDLPVVWFVKEQLSDEQKKENTSSLSVIFRYPAMKAVWLLFVYGMLLYLLFNAKRRQRIIPVLKPVENTTVEFVRTIGNLYLQEGNTTDIFNKKVIYFLDKVRHKFLIDTTRLDDNFIEKLCLKSGKPKELIIGITEEIKSFYRLKIVSEDKLIVFNNLLEKFWNETK